METTINKYGMVVLGCIIFLLSCETELFEISNSPDSKPNTLIQSVQTGPDLQKSYDFFDFQVNVTDCGRSGKTLEAFMPSLDGYFINWMTDGEYAGSKAQLLCVLANKVEVLVTRRSDGLSRSKTINIYEGPDGFDFDLLWIPCFAGGFSLEVSAEPNELGYAYLWEVDGMHAGHKKSIQCACGTLAKVRVTRLADGAIKTKTSKLTPCGEDE